MPRKALQLKNKKFGRWTVIERFTPYPANNKGVEWKCICDCGNIGFVNASSLNLGSSQSCGCLAKELTSERSKLPEGEAAFNLFYNSYVESANRRNLCFNITKKEFKTITSRNCHYCGAFPRPFKKLSHVNGCYFGNGIDRIENNIGYVIKNLVPCCTSCNFLKGKLDYKEFIDLVKRIHDHLFLKE